MEIHQNINLKPYNTFGIAATAKHFLRVTSLDQLRRALQLTEFPDKIFLGGGSNILLSGDPDPLVVLVDIRGIRKLWEDDTHVVLKVMAGENWHNLVEFAVKSGYGGLENLSLIPGNVGTAPIQNIGAYGVELQHVMESCEAMEIATGKLIRFSNEECRFGYRDSIFKQEARGQFVVCSVTFKLTRKAHQLNTSYGAIKQELDAMGIKDPGIADVSRAVMAIRRRKLPDPAELGNSGSFFKNPVIPIGHYRDLLIKYPELPHYPIDSENCKVPAGYLIEKCGFKGKRQGDAGVHKNQALVLVNYGNASGLEILNLAKAIIAAVDKEFGITLEPEVNIIGGNTL